MIKVLLFAELQDAAGTDQLEVDMVGATINEVKSWLHTQYNLPSLDQTMVAVNESYAEETYVVREGDVIAFIPPVSGG
ncbi:molybdopterin converting factor [Halalkalibacter wakoensis JCM 9140]|uniref:Molybdopterin synthase sulfur carrier subunit n=1 Tax=Halalkalibacter wakoensis JCM 9140 TaxID=1236970 RepID=W4Q2W8_9BACI|nr:molybdopterin converting factor subunit 1 [Halalkalibacter wakoensis]GAE25714.1 molybdopterin converting factor [Halalkalibacter wakoensis JCM 9140]